MRKFSRLILVFSVLMLAGLVGGSSSDEGAANDADLATGEYGREVLSEAGFAKP